MTSYEKLKKKYKITIWILIIGLLLLIYSITTTNATIMSIIGPLSIGIVVIDFFIFKNYQKKLRQAEIVKIGTEEANKNK